MSTLEEFIMDGLFGEGGDSDRDEDVTTTATYDIRSIKLSKQDILKIHCLALGNFNILIADNEKTPDLISLTFSCKSGKEISFMSPEWINGMPESVGMNVRILDHKWGGGS